MADKLAANLDEIQEDRPQPKAPGIPFPPGGGHCSIPYESQAVEGNCGKPGKVVAPAKGLLGREWLPHGMQEDRGVGGLLDVGEIAASGGQEPNEGPHDGLVGEAGVAAMGRRLVPQRHRARRGKQASTRECPLLEEMFSRDVLNSTAEMATSLANTAFCSLHNILHIKML